MPKSRRQPRPEARGAHSHRRARKLPPRSPASWAELVEKVQTDPAAADTLFRLRWTFFADSEPRYLDPTGSKRHDESAAEARFIEWAILDYRPAEGNIFEPFGGLRDWLEANGVDLSPSGPLGPWVRSLGGAFIVETYDSGEGTVYAIADGQTYTVEGLSALNPSVGDVLVGRLLPTSARHSPTPSTVVAPAGASQMARERREWAHKAAADPSASDGLADPWPLMSETWLGASPWWPALEIGAPELLSDVSEFLDAVDIDLTPTYLLSELSGVDDPVVVWSRLWQDLRVGTPTELLLMASIVTAIWATTSSTTLERLASADEQTLDQWFRETTMTLLTRVFEPAGQDGTHTTLPAPREGAWVLASELRDALAALPRTESIWIGERRAVELVRTSDDGIPEYWHAIVWVDEGTEDVVATTLCPADAPHDELWRVFAKAATAPTAGEPRLPATALCSRIQNAASAHPTLSGLGVTVDVSYEPNGLDDAFLAIEERLSEEPAYQIDTDVLTRYLSFATNTPAAVAEMYAAAAALYRLEPWAVVSRNLLVSVVVDEEPDVRVSAWLSDTSRPELKVYRDMWTLLEFAALTPEDEDEADANAEDVDAIHVSFPSMKAGRDPLLVEAQAHRWPLARDRYPVMVVQTSPAAPPRLVCGDEISVVTAILHAWRALVETHRAALSAGQPAGPVKVETHGHRVSIEATSGPGD